jgi:benzoate transport
MIADRPMHWRQVIAVAVCIALNALDGFDVLAISFAAPGIATEWGIDRAMLGVVLSIELFGMAAGSALLGNVADRFGRKPTVIFCLSMMALGMFGASLAVTIPTLALARLLTGLGIGGMLSSTSAMVAEVSNTRRRNLNLSLNIAGYSAGAILGGSVASLLLARSGDWRAVFQFGCIATLVALPLAIFLLPESIESLLARRPPGALERINRILRIFAREPLAALPPAEAPPIKAPIGALFTQGYTTPTVLLTLAYFAQIMFFYYIQKWIPTIISKDMGHTPAEAGVVLVMTNVGCLIGACTIGLVSQRFRVIPLIVGAMLVSFTGILVFSSGDWTLQQMGAICAVTGFFVNGAVVGLYPVMAQTYPAALRASGIGFAIGVGRGGAALSPMAAGALFAQGASLLAVSTVMGSGALVAAAAVLTLSRTTSQLRPS